MLDSRDSFLFCGETLWNVLEFTKQVIVRDIDELDGDRFLKTTLDDLCFDFVGKGSFEVPELDESKIAVDQVEADIDPRNSPRVFHVSGPGRTRVKGTKVIYSIPFTGDPEFFGYQASTSTSITPHGMIQGPELLVSFQGANLNKQQVNAEFDRNLQEIRSRLGWLSGEIENYHRQLPGLVRQHLELRRQKLEQDRKLLSSLGYPLKRREDPSTKYIVPVARKKLVTALSEGRRAASQDPYLQQADYEDILETIQNMALVIERSPAAFKGLHEEELRWLFLVPLNEQDCIRSAQTVAAARVFARTHVVRCEPEHFGYNSLC